MPRGYVELDLTEVQAVLWDHEFISIPLNGVMEHTFQRRYGETDYAVRVFSSIDTRNDTSRESGNDAIRIVIWDLVKNKPAMEQRVYRTQNAVTNMLERCKEMWSYVAKNRCPDDGALMIERKGPYGKFMGCSNYPTCRKVKPIS